MHALEPLLICRIHVQQLNLARIYSYFLDYSLSYFLDYSLSYFLDYFLDYFLFYFLFSFIGFSAVSSSFQGDSHSDRRLSFGDARCLSDSSCGGETHGWSIVFAYRKNRCFFELHSCTACGSKNQELCKVREVRKRSGKKNEEKQETSIVVDRQDHTCRCRLSVLRSSQPFRLLRRFRGGAPFGDVDLWGRRPFLFETQRTYTIYSTTLCHFIVGLVDVPTTTTKKQSRCAICVVGS